MISTLVGSRVVGCCAPLAAWMLIALLAMPAPDPVLAEYQPTGQRIALVNQVDFHLEIVAGMLHVLRNVSTQPVHVYLHPRVLHGHFSGFVQWIGESPGFVFRSALELQAQHFDLAIFVSPEYTVPYVEDFLSKTAAKLSVFLIHNSKTEHLEALTVGLPSRTRLATLAPHVSKSLAERRPDGSSIDWLLPVRPHQPNWTCALEDLTAGRNCIRGFSIQGRVESSRRNYSQLWTELAAAASSTQLKAAPDVQRKLTLNIIGQKTGERFHVPHDIKPYVHIHNNLPYPHFYDVIYHSFALAPMLASDIYLHSKISSTVVSALVTGVPLLADEKLMEAYTLLSRDAVFLQYPGQEVNTMLTILHMPPAEVWKKRVAMQQVATDMNKHATEVLHGWLSEAAT